MHRPFLACLAAAIGLTIAKTGAASETPTRLPEFFVSGERVGALDIVVPRDDLRAPGPNVGQDLLTVPGVYGHARAADAMEPSIRGLGLDRVATTLNGIALGNASPERTNSPVVILGPAAVTGIVVTKALPSVTLGPVTTGGRISLETGGAILEGDRTFDAQLTTTYDGARDGFTSRGRVLARSGAWNANVTAFHNRLGNYTSPNGREVAARLDEQGASAGLAWLAEKHQIRAEFLHRRLRLQDTLSLPLDGKNTDTEAFTLSHRWTPDAAGPLQTIEWRAGYGFTDPYITSENRTLPVGTSAEATSRSLGAGFSSVWRVSERSRVNAGVDYSGQDRRAVRTTPVGKDFIWPNAVYDDVGIFAEWNRVLTPAWHLRLGVRGDEIQSDAKDADQLALGRPIRSQFVTYNGSGADKLSRHDRVGATNVLLEWKPRPIVSAFVGAGLSVQPAQATERYRAFLNALGGDGRGGNALELGNPALRSERKAALEAGGALRPGWADFEATVYYYEVDDFILRKPIGTTQPPIAPMVVFGYRNVDADFLGAELGATFKPAEGWTVPLTFAVANGHNRETGTGLSEIPPWEVTFAVRRRGLLRNRPVALELGGRLVAAKDNPAPLDNPLFANAGGFAIYHARVGIPLGPRLKIEAGIENLFDRNYSEYLSPPVAPFRPATGNLMPGERVPAPGRYGWASVTLAW